jgi:GNAT superfamily N-acetyltransferase
LAAGSSDTAVRIESFDPGTASERDWQALCACEACLSIESDPDADRVQAAQAFRSQVEQAPRFVTLLLWGAWRREARECVGLARAVLPHTHENRHLAFFHLTVIPRMRRRGIGRRLLARVASAASQQGRRLLATATTGDIPAGAQFMRRLEARATGDHQTWQLDLDEVDSALLRRWQEQASERAAGFTLECWEGAYPEAALAEVALMKRAMRFAPPTGRDIEHWEWTADVLRELDRAQTEAGTQRWTLVTREPEGGTITGYTETFWNPAQPDRLEQGNTAVFPAYRNRGLGCWLKAAMLAKVIRERPQVQRVTTAQSAGNAEIARLNTRLGFRLVRRWSMWEVDLARVMEYLKAREASTDPLSASPRSSYEE